MQQYNCYTVMLFLDNWYWILIAILLLIVFIKWQSICPSLPKYLNSEIITETIGEMYLGGKKTYFSDIVFIVTNIGIDRQTYTDKFEGFFYSISKENTFRNQIINTKNSEDDWTISDYIYHNFGLKIGETMTCIYCHQNKATKIL